MKPVRFAVYLMSLFGAVTLVAQTATITGVAGEGVNASCPGGIGFVNGTNLGNTSTAVVVGTKAAYVVNAFNGTSLQIQFPVDAPLGATTIKAGNSAPFNITLVQYCPGIPVDSGVTAAFHMPSGTKVTAAFPATPNESIGLAATGLGPTNPVYATGTAPSNNDPSAVTVSKPTVTVGGKSATVTSAALQPNNPGFYAVLFTMPATVTSGPQQIALSIGGLTSTASIPVSTGPVVGSVSNAATYVDIGPRYGIAPGSIFVLKGLNLGPANLSIAPIPFKDTTLSGTSVAVTVNGTTVQALLYYTSAGQIAALLPSHTPVGVGTLTATYNGQVGATTSIRVVPNLLGIFTTTSDGAGSGVVTFPDYSLVSTAKAANCGGVNTTCGAANPGDVLTIWSTGLGPITGNDAAGDGLGVNQTSVPLTIWLGNVQVTAAYQGRSGCCIGEDQIIFTVPNNTPLGCAVPLSVQINGNPSNTVYLPVAAAGSRTCTPAIPNYTAADVAATASSSSVTYGAVNLLRNDQASNGGAGFVDKIELDFFRLGIAPAVQPFFFSHVDQPPPNTCHVYNGVDGHPDPPFDSLTGLNIGPITLQGPNGTKTFAVSQGGYEGQLSSTGNYLSPGSYTVSGVSGTDVPAFSTSFTIPAMPVMTSPQPGATTPLSVTRASGLTITWTGGSPGGYIELDGFSATDNTYSRGASFRCVAPAGPGTFTVPANVLLALPPNNFGGLDFHPFANPVNLTGTGLNVTGVYTQFDNFAPLIFK